MKKPSLMSMIVLSLAVHGLLLAGGWAAVRSLFRIDVGERVMAVITADYYKTEAKREEPPSPPAPRDPAGVGKKEPVKKAKKMPSLPGSAADGSAAAAAAIPAGPEPEVPGEESASPTHEVEQASAKAAKEPPAPAKAESKGMSEERTVSLIHAAVKKAVVYPSMARKHGIEGVVQVSFSVTSGGGPSKILVEKSSGFDILDQAAVQAVKNGKPYPAIAKAVEVPIRFSLKE